MLSLCGVHSKRVDQPGPNWALGNTGFSAIFLVRERCPMKAASPAAITIHLTPSSLAGRVNT
jgi:hypothetical protein